VAQRRSPTKAQRAGAKAAAAASKAMKGFSKGEQDLYKNVRQIKAGIAAEERAVLDRTQAYFEERNYEG